MQTPLVSARLHDLVSDTFRLGLSLAAGSKTLYPLVATMEAGIMRHQVFVDRERGDHGRLAEAHIADLPPHVTMYAYLRSDTTTVSGRASSVLVVEAEERGMTGCARFLQPYVPARFLRPFRAVSSPYLAGTGRRRFADTNE